MPVGTKKLLFVIALTAIIAGAAVAGAFTVFQVPGAGTTNSFKVAAFCHSSAGDLVWAAVERGYRAAESALGCKVVLRYAEGDIHKQADMIREAAAGDYNAIITSIEDPTIYDDPIALAKAHGMVTVAVFDDDVTPNARDIFVGPKAGPNGELCDYYVAWKRCQLADDRGHLFDGAKILYAAEDPSMVYVILAKQAIQDYCKYKNYKVTINEIECTYDLATIEERIRAYLTANPDTDLILGSGCITDTGACLVLENGGYTAGTAPYHYGWVTCLDDARSIQKGYSPAGVAFSASTMGYLAVMNAYFIWKNPGVMPKDIRLDPLDVTPQNVGALIDGLSSGLF
jgi:simple sugar transport system substrate-binding protein